MVKPQVWEPDHQNEFQPLQPNPSFFAPFPLFSSAPTASFRQCWCAREPQLSQAKASLASSEAALPSGGQPLSALFRASFPLAPFPLPDVKHSCLQLDNFLQMKSMPLTVLPVTEGPGCPCVLRYWGGSYKEEQLACTTWVSGAGGLLTQCPALLAFLQMCVPGVFFPVESHFAISCPVPGHSPTPFLPTRSCGPCLAARVSFPDSPV